MIRPLQITLLVILTVAVYLPSINTLPFIFDDLGMMDAIEKVASSKDFSTLFFTDNSRYFRPLIQASYLLDYYLWGLNPTMMRLTNIIIHSINTLLVFFIAYTLTDIKTHKEHTPTFILAAVYALHPLHTEAVNWISGRTDPLAGLFALAGVLCFVLFERKKRIRYLWLSSLLLLTGSYAKEVTFCIFPGLLFYLLIRQASKETYYNASWRFKAAIPYLTGLSIYLVSRYYCIRGVDQSLSKLTGIHVVTTATETNHVLNSFLQALGFYGRKLIIPTPLNFAIDRVPEYSVLIGVVVIFLCLWVGIRRDIVSCMAILMLLTIAPAAINALLNIAWTPYAERYMYIPVAFFLLTVYALTRSSWILTKGVTAVLVCLFVFYLPVTFQRNLLWANPLELLQKTVTSEPDNYKLRTNYTIALASYGHFDQARHQLDVMKKKNQDIDFERYFRPKISFLQGDMLRARRELDIFYRQDHAPEEHVLELMNKVEEQLFPSHPVPPNQAD